MLLELIERVFERLTDLGYDEVRARLSRGEHLGDAQLVREWLELHTQEPPQTPVASAINARQRR
jgi:hypothetical protein